LPADRLVWLRLGALVLLGAVSAGGLLGAWALVYDRCMCAEKPLNRPALTRAVAAGALAAPVFALVGSVLGTGFWVAVALGAMAWAADVSADGKVKLPHW
jgi:hypothetical protein